MFDSKSFKKSALEQLKGRWTIPCVATLIIFAILITIQKAGTIINTSICALVLFFIYGAISIAYANLFTLLYLSKDKIKFSNFTDGFSESIKGFLAFLWVFIWVFLWSLLFIIPGIIKSIAYSQIFFILSDNPKIGVKKALNISKIITKDHKADLFTLYLSFIGWLLLCVISGGILYIWITPYLTLTFTNSYFYLKQEAIRIGILTPADFEN